MVNDAATLPFSTPPQLPPPLTHARPACARCDQVERALNLFTEMEQMSLMPTHVTFNAMINATGRSFRHAERAYGLFEQT